MAAVFEDDAVGAANREAIQDPGVELEIRGGIDPRVESIDAVEDGTPVDHRSSDPDVVVVQDRQIGIIGKTGLFRYAETGALAVNQPDMAVREGAVGMGRERGQTISNGVRKQPIIGIEKDDVVPGAHRETCVPGSSNAAVVLSYTARLSAPCCNHCRVVSRPVINDEDFRSWLRLA